MDMTFDLADFAEQLAASVSLTPAGQTFVATDLAGGEFSLAVFDAVTEATSPIPASLLAAIRDNFVGQGYLTADDEAIFKRTLRERERTAA